MRIDQPVIGTYVNGNALVRVYADGTKTRSFEGRDFRPAFAESCDVTITHRCSNGCPYCYADCAPDKPHGLLDRPFLDTLRPYTEMAVAVNDMSHPMLDAFLEKIRERRAIANVTVNQADAAVPERLARIRAWQDAGLVHGVGVSVDDGLDEALCARVHETLDHVVFHAIAGVIRPVPLVNLAMATRGQGRLLLLGYKTNGRGGAYLGQRGGEVATRVRWLAGSLPEVVRLFAVTSFDNKALEDLDVRHMPGMDKWDDIYMGADGTSTFYMDLVDGTFAPSSVSPPEDHMPIGDLSMDGMFLAASAIAERRMKGKTA